MNKNIGIIILHTVFYTLLNKEKTLYNVYYSFWGR